MDKILQLEKQEIDALMSLLEEPCSMLSQAEVVARGWNINDEEYENLSLRAVYAVESAENKSTKYPESGMSYCEDMDTSAE